MFCDSIIACVLYTLEDGSDGGEAIDHPDKTVDSLFRV